MRKSHLGDLDEPAPAVLLHVQVESLRLDLQHLRRQLLLLGLLPCSREHTITQLDYQLIYVLPSSLSADP